MEIKTQDCLKCPKCGNELTDKEIFYETCLKCGETLEKQEFFEDGFGEHQYYTEKQT